MKLRKIICLALACLLLAACGGSIAGEDIEGCWLMGQDLEYRYLARFGGGGSMEILWVRTDSGGDDPVAFRMEGRYALEGNVLTREYDREIPENSALGLPAELTIRDGGLILDYGELSEYWARLSEEAEALCLSGKPGVECPDCEGLGIRGIREDLPLWCETCCGLGAVMEE